ncbi:hypothetical protein TNCV_3558731 [Trichonephila clavipes]|uniref:Uncharacterized protein n=1 Tax=Trichonephila clavipes TaxID=2585209 RepID=A0A8X6WCQ9_TRICX|nr:hypothetical protein TNCV_3558731 [Trichonephila clavipes]
MMPLKTLYVELMMRIKFIEAQNPHVGVDPQLTCILVDQQAGKTGGHMMASLYSLYFFCDAKLTNECNHFKKKIQSSGTLRFPNVALKRKQLPTLGSEKLSEYSKNNENRFVVEKKMHEGVSQKETYLKANPKRIETKIKKK